MSIQERLQQTLAARLKTAGDIVEMQESLKKLMSEMAQRQLDVIGAEKEIKAGCASKP
jgi:hypothetical protein